MRSPGIRPAPAGVALQKRVPPGTFFPLSDFVVLSRFRDGNLTCTPAPHGATSTNFHNYLEGTMTKPGPNKAQRRSAALAKLAELYPACFAAEASGPHRPLKIGIYADLRKRGLKAAVVGVLGVYTRRPAYLKALAAGGPRYDLDGNPCGEVTADQMTDAQAKIEAAVKATQEREEAQRIGRKALEAIRMARSEREAQPTGRLSLADLKAAAQARKAAQRAA
jgi:sRNA-binding protein